MASHEQTQYPGYVQPPQNPAFSQQAYSQPPAGHPQQPPADYPQPPTGYPQPPTGYPQPPADYPVPPIGCPQQQGYQPPPGFVQQHGHPQQSTAYPQGSVNYVNKPPGSSPPPFQTAVSTYGQPPVIPNDPVPASYEEEEEEQKEDTAVDYSDKTPWQAFIRIVFAIFTVQLAVLDGIIAVCQFMPIVKSRLTRSDCTISGIILAILYFSLLYNCFAKLRRMWQANIIIMPLLTISMGYFVGSLSSVFDNYVCLYSIGISSTSCLAVAILSFHPKFDFTVCKGILIIHIWIIFVSGVIATFTYEEIKATIIAGGISLLFMTYVSYNTRLMTKGKNSNINCKEYSLAVMTFYYNISIVICFFCMNRKLTFLSNLKKYGV